MDSPHLAQEDRKAINRTLRAALIFAVVLATLLLGVLAIASGNTQLFERHYAWLLGFSLAIAALLLLLVFELLRRLVQRYRRGLFGTKLMARMATTFVAMTVVPVALIFLVAVQFVERSVESWFDLPVGRALESGLNLGRTSMESLNSDLLQKARAMAGVLNDQPPEQWSVTLNRLREQAGVQEAMILTAANRVIAVSGSQLLRLVPDLPPANALRQVRLTRQFSGIESLGQSDTAPANSLGATKGYRLRSIVVVATDGALADDAKYLQLLQQVPTAIAENADAVQQGYRDYQELSLSRAGLKRVFRVTLVLTFLLTLFSAIAGAFLLAGWLTGPLAELASATKSVAEGDFRQLKNYTNRDELGVLTQSFNRMTQQLDDARSQVLINQERLVELNSRLQSILANLNAGVLVLDSDMRLSVGNVGAEQIIGQGLSNFIGLPLEDIPRVNAIAQDVRQAFNESAHEAWQRQFEIPSERPDVKQSLFARGSVLELTEGNVTGYVLVFDDVSELVSAQRAVAWAEVARRLAHEIKNPLTPIQLAAERMQMKLQAKLEAPELEILDRNTRTIVNQVTALKYLVDEFRDYARLPAARLDSLDLNALIEEILPLYPDNIVTKQLDPDLPRILGDATLLRQVVHNLVKNALETTEKASHPQVVVSTRVNKLLDGQVAVRFLVNDNGSGFDDALLRRAFEPYVTTKPRGSGLGLPIVKKIIEEHGARIELSNVEIPIKGAQVGVLFTKLAKNEHNTSNK